MERFLVVGVETVVGANFAASMAERYHVSTWSAEPGYEFPNCSALSTEVVPAEVIRSSRPDWIIYCGPAARSAWDPTAESFLNDEMVVAAQEWSAAAQQAGVRFAMISSDAIFTGPWMFHEEDSLGLGTSFHAHTVRAAESQVLEYCPDALIIRTNVFGWSPNENGWLETLLSEVETRRVMDQDHIRHATPILATDFAEILERACQENLRGIYHVAGAERISPLKFAQRLADQFDLPWLAVRKDSTLHEVPTGYGEGECSLQTKKVRKALCVAMPLMSEGLSRLIAQANNGYRDKLRIRTRQEHRRAA